MPDVCAEMCIKIEVGLESGPGIVRSAAPHNINGSKDDFTLCTHHLIVDMLDANAWCLFTHRNEALASFVYWTASWRYLEASRLWQTWEYGLVSLPRLIRFITITSSSEPIKPCDLA